MINNIVTDIKFTGGNITKQNVSLKRKCWGSISLTINYAIRLENLLIVYEPYNNEFVCMFPEESALWKIIDERFKDEIKKNVEKWGKATYGSK